MTLCLPSHILDSLFGVSKRQKTPPSHVLVQVSIFTGGGSAGGGNSSWLCLPFAIAAHVTVRDWRGANIIDNNNNDDGDDVIFKNPVQNAFLDCTNLLFHPDHTGGDRDTDDIGSVLDSMSSHSALSPSSVALPPSVALGSALVQSFLDIPVVVDALMIASSKKRLRLEQCTFVKNSADPCAVTPGAASSSPSRAALSLSSVRLRFAVPVFMLQQAAAPAPATSTLTMITLRLVPSKRRNGKSSEHQQQHEPEMGRILLNEHLLNSLAIASGGQGCVFSIPVSTSAAASNSNDEQKDNNEAASTEDARYVVSQTAPTSVGIIGPETRIVVNTAASAALVGHSNPAAAAVAGTAATTTNSDTDAYLDFHGELSRMERLIKCGASVPRGLLVTSRGGNGKTAFVAALAARVFGTPDAVQENLHHVDLKALEDEGELAGDSSALLASRIVANIKSIAARRSAGTTGATCKPWLVLDDASSFFSSFSSESEGDFVALSSPSPASRLLSILSSHTSRSLSGAFSDQVLLVCTLPHAKAHLVSDTFRRKFFSGSCCSVDLQLPSESQRLRLLQRFLLGRRPQARAENDSDAQCVITLAQQTTGGYSVADLKKYGLLIEQKQQKQASSSVSLAQILQATPIPRPQMEMDARKVRGGGTAGSKIAPVTSNDTKKTSWSDIAGLESVKAAVQRAILWPIQNPAKAKLFGMERLSGIMLHGPPGNAKTTIARAICCEGGFSAFFHLDCATVLSAFVGEAERFIRDTFIRARAQSPSVIFFDEIESFGSKRKSGSNGDSSDIGVRLLATLLTEMDGVSGNSSSSDADSGSTASFGVCVIGATNLLHLVDDALLRPGRFDLLLSVPLPGPTDRELIFKHCLDKSNMSGGIKLTADVSQLAAMSRDFSGAEITGAWRDGVVSAVIAHGRKHSLLLGDDDGDDGAGDDSSNATIEMNVTASVAASLRALAKKK